MREVALAPFVYDPMLKFQFWITDSPMNQSLRGAIARIVSDGHKSPDFATALRIAQSPQFAVALRAVTGLYILVVGLVILKSRRFDR